MDDMVKNSGLQKKKKPMLHGRARTLPYHAAMYLLEGSGTFRDRNTPEREVGPGTAFYLFPGVEHCYDPYPGTEWTEYWVLFDGFAAEQCFGPLVPDHALTYPGMVPELIQAYESLYRYQRETGPASPLLAAMELHRVLGLIFRYGQERKQEPFSLVIQAAVTLIQHHLRDRDIDLRGLAQQYGIEFETFRKKFRLQTGTSPYEYFLNLKFAAAQRYLLAGHNVKQTAGEFGFDDPYYFSRLFKQHLGLAPACFTSGRRS